MIRRFKINHESPAKSRNSQITACGIGELVIILSSYNHHKARSPVTARINLFLQGTGGLNIEEIGEKLLTLKKVFEIFLEKLIRNTESNQ
jgi:hypothetical protein